MWWLEVQREIYTKGLDRQRERDIKGIYQVLERNILRVQIDRQREIRVYGAREKDKERDIVGYWLGDFIQRW